MHHWHETMRFRGKESNATSENPQGMSKKEKFKQYFAKCPLNVMFCKINIQRFWI